MVFIFDSLGPTGRSGSTKSYSALNTSQSGIPVIKNIIMYNYKGLFNLYNAWVDFGHFSRLPYQTLAVYSLLFFKLEFETWSCSFRAAISCFASWSSFSSSPIWNVVSSVWQQMLSASRSVSPTVLKKCLCIIKLEKRKVTHLCHLNHWCY